MAKKEDKKEVKKVQAKKAEVKKAEPKKAEVKKAQTKKVEPKKVETKKAEVKKAAISSSKSKGTYHVAKRDDGLWTVKLAQTNGAAGKVIKTFKTKVEAEAYVKQLSENSGRTALVHASKGKNKGKIQ